MHAVGAAAKVNTDYQGRDGGLLTDLRRGVLVGTFCSNDASTRVVLLMHSPAASCRRLDFRMRGGVLLKRDKTMAQTMKLVGSGLSAVDSTNDTD